MYRILGFRILGYEIGHKSFYTHHYISLHD